MATTGIPDFNGIEQQIENPLAPGRGAAAASKPVVLSTEDKAALDAVATQTTLAAVLAKIIAAPATEATVAAMLTALQIMDDWDESDRAKVNPIVGQAGVAAGAGAVGATVQRVTQASDSPVMVSLGATTSTAAGVDQNGDLIAQVRQLTKANSQLPTSLVATMLATVATLRSDQIYAGAALTPKFAAIAASSSGANTVVAAVTSKKIRVLAWDLMPNGAVNAKWQTSAPTDLTGLYYMAAAGNGVARAFNPLGYFETVAGEGLVLNLSGAVAVGGSLVYIEV